MNARSFPIITLITGMAGRKKTGRLLPSLLLTFLLLLSLAGCAQPLGNGSFQPGNPATSAQQPASPGSTGSGLQPLASGEMRVSVIDVGQGDSILVQLPDGETMLVDGGPTVAGPSVVAYLRRCGVKRIDYLVATHPHEDHIGGLLDVLPQFTVDKIFMTKGITN
ncbi:MAG: MBL fold metallo-hydrolase, partial [Thermacetogeniaceae bacterium]